jgi:GDP-4-dehydro-6-deoxy-D-mannose reductase
VSSLVTGAGGFVGQWLIRALIERGERVTGFTLGTPSTIGVLTTQQRERVNWIEGDICDTRAVENAIHESEPNAVYHLAGVTFVPAAGTDPAATYEVNTIGVARLLAAVARRGASGAAPPRVLVVGSAEQYGPHDPSECPLVETVAQKPATVYAASKAAQEIIALQAFSGFSIPVIATRSFNHSGRGQEPRFLLPGLIQRLRSLAQSGGHQLPIGNTTTVRDFLHVSDVVSAYIALVERGRPGEVYNVASGKGWSVGELVDLALRITGVDAKPQRDESLARAADVEWLVGDSAKLRKDTGWAPTRSVEDIMRELWNA